MYDTNAFDGLNVNLSNLSYLSQAESRSISAENKTGEKGMGGRAETGVGAACARELGVGWKVSPQIEIKAGETVTIADINASGSIKHIWMTPAGRCRHLIFRIYWDGQEFPSVECPIGDFFASAYDKYAQLSSLAVCVNPKSGYNCYWDMPFRKSCKMTVENIGDENFVLFYQIDYILTKKIPDCCAYFHAQFRRVNPLPYKDVYTIVDNISGSGHYVGTYMAWGVNNNGWWGEGEIKFYIDGDKEFPTICGTGTEDYFGGSYNFDVDGKYVEFSSPYSGMPVIIRPDGLYASQQRFSLYRWHITDPIRFKSDLKVTIQALGWRNGGRFLPLQDDIASVAFFYQTLPANKFPDLPSKDELEII
jgi:hypothetical protein